MIHIQNLSKTYATPHGRFEALRGIELLIEQGEVFGIIGPSGAGKSTLVQCINLLERPDQGSISRRPGVDRPERVALAGPTPPYRYGVSGFQPVVAPHGLRQRGLAAGDRRRAAPGDPGQGRAAAGAGRPAASARPLPQPDFGGQKQRVGIARALANDPDVLLSDEATSALDPETTHNILALLRDINRKTGVTVVMITHQMEVVREICDRRRAVARAGRRNGPYPGRVCLAQA
ncbi:D-methionine ABC transporter ATP-binding protein [Bordetella holmesii]|nr:D-methionine ABC transporter ATP-binding protein [Bordetella holmesii]